MNNIALSLIALSLIILFGCLYSRVSASSRREPETFASGNICTVQLTNINPMFAKNYMQYDGKPIKCFNKLSSKAFCVGGTLKMDVQSVGVDANGVPLAGKQTAVITNSNGSTPPDNALIPITPWEFPSFFCLD